MRVSYRPIVGITQAIVINFIISDTIYGPFEIYFKGSFFELFLTTCGIIVIILVSNQNILWQKEKQVLAQRSLQDTLTRQQSV